jgi:hypothetical protein
MEPKSRLRHTEDQAQAQAAELASQHATKSESAADFATPEALLRHDAAQTAVPPEVAARLRDSLAGDPPPPPASWWRRLLGR